MARRSGGVPFCEEGAPRSCSLGGMGEVHRFFFQVSEVFYAKTWGRACACSTLVGGLPSTKMLSFSQAPQSGLNLWVPKSTSAFPSFSKNPAMSVW